MKSKGVSVRKAVCGGEPCIAGTRVPTKIVYNLFMAGHSMQSLTRRLCARLTLEQVETAIRYETRGRVCPF